MIAGSFQECLTEVVDIWGLLVVAKNCGLLIHLTPRDTPLRHTQVHQSLCLAIPVNLPKIFHISCVSGDLT